MPITSILKPIAVRCGYGSSTSGAYYWDSPETCVVGLGEGESVENHVRLTFEPPRKVLANGALLEIQSAALRLNSVSDVSRTIRAEFSSMSDWSVPYEGAVDAAVAANDTTVTSIDSFFAPGAVSLLANATTNVFVHLKASDIPRATLTGWNAANPPELILRWDFAGNTIHTDTLEAMLGTTEVTWTITPVEEGERYDLTYQLGSVTGTVATGASSTTIAWTPPKELGTAIPTSNTGIVTLMLAVYNANGEKLREETTYLAVRYNPNDVATLTSWGDSYAPVVPDGNYLVGETLAVFAPVISMAGAYGTTPVSVQVWAGPGVSSKKHHLLSWTPEEMTANGTTYTCTAKTMPVFEQAGEYWKEILIKDARGNSSNWSQWDEWVSIREYFRPSISLFSAERYGPIYDDDQQVIGYQSDPTGEKVWFRAKGSIATVGGANTLNWTLMLTSRKDGTVVSVSGTAVGTVLSWSDNLELIGDIIDPETAWDATLTITDRAGFPVSAYDVVPAGKAVLHLPVSKAGVAFGGLSHATVEEPAAECYYPLVPYEGIRGVTDWSTVEVDTGGRWLDGCRVYRKTVYARLTAHNVGVDISYPDGLARLLRVDGMLYSDDTPSRTRPVNWYYPSYGLYASTYNGGGHSISIQAYETGLAVITIWYTKEAGIAILKQPEDCKVAAGATATFTVDAWGNALSYQWQRTEFLTATVGPASVLHVTDALNVPVSALTVDVALLQEGSGTPSPSNVRSVSGWTGAKIYIADTEPVLDEGRNLLPVSDTTIGLPYTQPLHALTYTRGSNGWINVSSPAISATGNFVTTLWGYGSGSNAWLGTGTYTFTVENDDVLLENQIIGLRVYGNGISGDGSGTGTTGRYFYGSGVYTIKVTGHITNIAIYYKGASNGLAVGGRIRVKLEKGSASTGWTPAPEDLATLADVSFGQTVYGAALDALTGALTITTQMDTYDGSDDETWELMSPVGSRRYFRGRISGQYIDPERHGANGVTSNWLSIVSSTEDQTYTLSSLRLTTYTYASNYLFLLLGTDLPDITTVAELRAYLSAHPLQVCYALASPVSTTVTPVAVATLKGENWVWADSGDTEMTYSCGTTWANISGKTASTLSITASADAATRKYRCVVTEGDVENVSDAAGIVIT